MLQCINIEIHTFNETIQSKRRLIQYLFFKLNGGAIPLGCIDLSSATGNPECRTVKPRQLITDYSESFFNLKSTSESTQFIA